MKFTLFVLLALASCTCALQGTTPHIAEVFKGRCYWKDPTSDCDGVWESFQQAWAQLPSDSVSASNYENFTANFANFSTPPNKAMLWSGSRDIVHELSDEGTRFWTLEDTVTGYVVNGLSWCAGAPYGPGDFNYTFCPPSVFDNTTNTLYGAEDAFWQVASTQFAKGIRGEFFLLLGATSDRLAYRATSFFAQFELPNLQNVTSITVYVIQNNTIVPPERCGSGSLVLLADAIAARNISMTCEDDPEIVEHLLCVDNPNSSQCKFAKDAKQSTTDTDLSTPDIIGIAIGSFCAGILLAAIITVVAKKASTNESNV